MKLSLLHSLAVLGMAAATSHASIIITEAMANSTHPGGAGNGDWFEIFNAGAAPVDLTGWSWDDDSATAGTHSFPGITLGIGGIALIVDEGDANISGWAVDTWGFTLDGGYSGPGVRTSTGVYVLSSDVMGGFSGLAAGGEAMYIFDQINAQVDTFNTGSQSSPNAGFSFARDNTGADLGRSIAGENGAFLAVGNGGGGPGSDVASPGMVVPEPSTFTLFALSCLAGLYARRRFK